MATKTGVATPSELKDFVSNAGLKLLVVDVRHPDPSVEPGDAKSLAVAGFPDGKYRPNAMNLPWSQESNVMDLPSVEKDMPIIGDKRPRSIWRKMGLLNSFPVMVSNMRPLANSLTENWP